MNTSNKLASKLKELRKAYSYTQDYCASVCGVSRQSYSHFETGRRTPSAEAIYKLANIYNLSADTLLELTIDDDDVVYYDSLSPSNEANELSKFLEYFNDPKVQKKFQFHNNFEKELLYYFSIIDDTDKKEIIEFTKIKSKKYK